MKSSRILLSVFAAALVMGCSEYDDSALWKKVDEAQKQLAELSASMTQLEGQIALLTAAKTGGVITDIKENPDGGVTITYTTADGRTSTATVAAKDDLSDIDIIGTKEENGVLYWTITVNGKTTILTDKDGAKIPVSGREPSFTTDKDGYWMVNGDYILDSKGEKIKSEGKKASLLTGVAKNDDGTVTLTLADGSTITVETTESFSFVVYYGDAPVSGEIKVPDGVRSLELTYKLAGKAAEKASVRITRAEGVEAGIDQTARRAIEKPLSSLPYSLSRHILEHLRKLTSHEPVIGIMGKSGAGKSSLCNALFQGEVTPVSDVHAGTREVRRFRLSGHGHSMVITDLPGVGESRDRDAEYEALYRDILPELDLVLWLIKADDRALSVDEYFWRHILHRGHQQVLFVVTQADKTEPCHEWDMAGIQPSPAQAQNIREKTEAVFRLFRPVHPVVAVSARTGWELDTLVSALMTALPDHAASPLMTRLQDELRTESVRAQAREQFTGAVDRIFDTAESVCVASVARTVLRAVRDTVVSVARAVWNWIFF